MSGDRPGYLAYLLRMWRVEHENGDVGWRASLERPGDGEQVGFPTLEATFEFLRQRTAEEPPAPHREGEETEEAGGPPS